MSETEEKTLADVAKELGLTVESVFVPFSQSRNAKPAKGEKPWRSLNWRVTLRKDGRDILTTDYSSGEAHAPSYKQTWGRRTVEDRERDLMVAWECEHGRKAGGVRHGSTVEAYGAIGGKKIEPDALSVLSSLASDADALDSATFEDWASENGYDPDSRKAEATYRACLEIALKFRNGLGDDALQRLRDAARDY